MPAPAPEMMAVRPFREKSGRTRSATGATVLLWVNFPSTIVPSILAGGFVFVLMSRIGKIREMCLKLSVGEGHARVFMFLIQGASNVGVTTSRGPQ
jgi:hypothetical protein